METYKPLLNQGLIISKGTVNSRQLTKKDEAMESLQNAYPITVSFVPINLPQ